MLLPSELLSRLGHWTSRSLLDYRLHLTLGCCETWVSIFEVNYVVLDVLRLVDFRHILKLCKKSMGFTVSIIKELVVESEVLQSSLIREVQVNSSLRFNELCHTRQLRLHSVDLDGDGISDFVDSVYWVWIRRVSIIAGAIMLLLMLRLASHTQGLRVSHAKVSDLLVVFRAKAYRILISCSIHGLLEILIALSV